MTGQAPAARYTCTPKDEKWLSQSEYTAAVAVHTATVDHTTSAAVAEVAAGMPGL